GPGHGAVELVVGLVRVPDIALRQPAVGRPLAVFAAGLPQLAGLAEVRELAIARPAEVAERPTHPAAAEEADTTVVAGFRGWSLCLVTLDGVRGRGRGHRGDGLIARRRLSVILIVVRVVVGD